jgi:hypothetical protein
VQRSEAAVGLRSPDESRANVALMYPRKNYFAVKKSPLPLIEAIVVHARSFNLERARSFVKIKRAVVPVREKFRWIPVLTSAICSWTLASVSAMNFISCLSLLRIRPGSF